MYKAKLDRVRLSQFISRFNLTQDVFASFVIAKYVVPHRTWMKITVDILSLSV